MICLLRMVIFHSYVKLSIKGYPSLDISREPRDDTVWTVRGFAEAGGNSEVSGAGLANQSASGVQHPRDPQLL